MAVAQTSLTSSNWVLIGNNVTNITFQCQSQFPVIIGITTTNVGLASTAPGLAYKQYEGELKRAVSDLSYETSPKYVWAKAASSYATIVYES